MSQDYDPTIDNEYPTAVAAAAFAINSLEQSRTAAQRKKNEGPDTSVTTEKNNAEDKTTRVSDRSTESRRSSEKRVSISDTVDESTRDAPSIKRTSTSEGNNIKITASTELPSGSLEISIDRSPSIRKTATFPSKEPESTVPKPDLPSTFPPTEIKRQSTTKPGIGDSKADIWEKAEMAKIKERTFRYEKLSTTILDWEKNKKTKARRRLDVIERELDERRAKAVKNYRSKMESIDQIAGGAKAQAEANRRNKETKVKEKANKIRSTGKLPATCLCF
ncbi:hypothetical protein RJ639_031329 [Escallonia herrerae]|uniref:Remorin C-terminal domain-containing protein n=1 Tax=Escallonia herrerae TaxID=1293975 RepID=A0AA88WXM6_9ASTE|nr:hypothetical protein RJ639_031329 [Escallonia herrerae]